MASKDKEQDQLGQETRCLSSSKYEMLIKGLKNMSQELRSMISTANSLIEDLNADNLISGMFCIVSIGKLNNFAMKCYSNNSDNKVKFKSC